MSASPRFSVGKARELSQCVTPGESLRGFSGKQGSEDRDIEQTALMFRHPSNLSAVNPWTLP